MACTIFNGTIKLKALSDQECTRFQLPSLWKLIMVVALQRDLRISAPELWEEIVRIKQNIR